MSKHSGHRRRIRGKIDEDGFFALSEIEQLEYFLYPFVPRKNTHYEAGKALEKCGDLFGVFLLDPSIYDDIPNMQPSVLTAIKRLSKIGEDYDLCCNTRHMPDVNSRKKLNDYTKRLFKKYPDFEVFFLFVDKQVRVKRVHGFKKSDFSTSEEILQKLEDLKWGIAICVFKFTTKEFAIIPLKFAKEMRKRGIVPIDLVFFDSKNRRRHYDKSIQSVKMDYILNVKNYDPERGQPEIGDDIMLD